MDGGRVEHDFALCFAWSGSEGLAQAWQDHHVPDGKVVDGKAGGRVRQGEQTAPKSYDRRHGVPTERPKSYNPLCSTYKTPRNQNLEQKDSLKGPRWVRAK